MSKAYWNCYTDMIDYSVYLFLFHRLIFDEVGHKYFSLIIIQCFVWSVLSGVSVCYFSMFSFRAGAYKLKVNTAMAHKTVPLCLFHITESVREKTNNLCFDQVRHKLGCTVTDEA